MTDIEATWQRVRTTFETLIELPPKERTRELEKLATADPELATNVRNLLDADSNPELPELDTAAARSLRESDSIRLDAGACIEGFRVVRFLAQGGMGAVYEAVQLHPERTVALKILRPELSVGSGLRRFELEARVLARLEHPHIAKVLAAGVYAQQSGPFALELPWYALEFLAKAQPITRYAREHRVDLRRRVAWMEQLADAIQHAHRRGVIHRDLKPGNLLIGSDGVPKIVDFGIARADDGPSDDPRTAAGIVLGTPAYMSPEQRQGLTDLDSRTDVFALGVVLRELCEEFTLSERGRELDWILARATADDRELRYGSAAELANDLRAWSTGELVAAAPPSRVYRLRKFLARHRAAVIGVAAVLAALASGLFVSILALDRARRSEAVARQNEVSANVARANAERHAAALAEEKATVAGVVDVLRATVTRAIGVREGRDASIADFCSELEHEIAREDLPPRTRALTANYLASVRFANGDWQNSAELSAVALELLTEAGLLESGDGVLAYGAHCEALRKLGRMTEAAAELDKGWDIAQRALAADDPTRLSMQRRVLLLALEQRRHSDAMALAADLLEARRSSLGEHAAQTLESELDLATCKLAANAPDAVAHALATIGRLATEAATPQTSLLALRTNLGVILARAKDYTRAVEQLEHAIAGYLAIHPSDHPSIAAVQGSLGAVLLESGDAEAAVQPLRAAVTTQTLRLASLHPQRLQNLATLARALRRSERAAEALGVLAKETRTLVDVPAASRAGMVGLWIELGLAHGSSGDEARGQAIHRQLVTQCLTLPADGAALAQQVRAKLARDYASSGLAMPQDLR